MKQAKKMLCMLLVMLLAFSTVSIGVSAAYTSYATPSGYDIHETPVLSTAQRGSQLLDYVDAMLYDMRDDLYIDITIMKLDFTSVDKALNTISGLEGAANLIGGDVGDLDIDALGSTRRGTAGKTDLDILYELLYFLNENRGIVGNFVKGELDLGIIKSFVDLDFNIHNLLADMLYEMLVDETYDVDNGAIDYNVWTADKMLQHAVDVILLGGTAADGDVEEGFLPSMAGKTNINTQTIWSIIENAANAATKDYLLPFIKNDLAGLIDELKAENPHDAWNLIDVSSLNLDNYVWGQYDSKNGIIAELNHFLYVVLDQVWTGDKFWVDGGNDKLNQNLEAALKIVYAELGELLLPASSEFLPVEDVEAMDLQQLVTYVAKQFIQAEMPYVLWEDSYGEPLPLDNIGQLACYVAYSIAADILPTNYMATVEDGFAEYGSDYALRIVADIGAYYLNGALPIEIGYGTGVEQFLNTVVNWLLFDEKGMRLSGFFKGSGISESATAWENIDNSVFAVLPLHKILGGGATGSKDLIMNKILGNIFDLNFEGILQLLYKADYSMLNQTVPKFIINIVNGVLNVIVTRNTQPQIFSTSLTTVEALIQNSNLAGSAERLLNGLYNAGRYQYFWDGLLPILNPILIDESGYSYNIIAPPAGYGINTLEGLQAHVESWEAILSEPDVYTTDGGAWNESEDYELWRYDKLESAIDYAWDVIDGYNGTVAWVAEANEQLAAANASGDANAITDAQNNLAEAQAELATYNATKYANAAYEIEYYGAKAAADQNEATLGHLEYLLWLVDSKGYRKKDYDSTVWEVYEKALDHAEYVYSLETSYKDGSNWLPSPDVKQSMVNAARKNLMDAMKLLEVKLADFTDLLKAIEEGLAANIEGKTEDSVAALQALIAEAQDIVSEPRTIDWQTDVDELAADIREAIKNLADFVETIIPELDILKDTVKVAGNLVYSLATQLTPDKLLAQFINSDENGTLEVDTVVDGVVGTGTKLILKDKDGEVVETYEAVIFGDANGDGLVDIMDTICLDLYTVNEVNYAENSAQWYALNLVADSAVDAADAILLDSYANFAADIDQGAIY